MKRLTGIILIALLTGCATTQQAVKKEDMSAFIAAAPRSILVVPVVNHSLDVDAPNYLLSTLSIPIAEKGYYVFPVNTTKFILEREGYYEGDRIHTEPPQALAKLFGADAILYVTIERWDAQYALISASVTVEFSYRLVYKDGTELWKNQSRMVYTPQNNNNSGGGALGVLISSMVNAALTRAAPNYMPLAWQANQNAFNGDNGLINGPYKQVEQAKAAAGAGQ